MSKILILGTSHAAGVCQRPPQTHLDKRNVWCHHLAKKFDCEYDLAAIGGTENWQLTQELISRKDQQYKFILAEVRLSSFLMPMPYDELQDELIEDLSVDNIQGFIGNAIRYQEQAKKFKNKQVVNTLFEAYQIYHSSVTSYYRSVAEINTMYNIAKLMNTDFYWTVFSETTLNQDNPVNQHFKKITNEKFKELFNKRVPSQSIRDKLGVNWNDNSCECGHFDETYQEQIAELLHKYIKEQG